MLVSFVIAVITYVVTDRLLARISTYRANRAHRRSSRARESQRTASEHSPESTHNMPPFTRSLKPRFFPTVCGDLAHQITTEVSFRRPQIDPDVLRRTIFAWAVRHVRLLRRLKKEHRQRAIPGEFITILTDDLLFRQGIYACHTHQPETLQQLRRSFAAEVLIPHTLDLRADDPVPTKPLPKLQQRNIEQRRRSA